MTSRILTVCLILIAACGVSSAATVFSENFSGGSGHFSGFGTGNCQWQTPGDYQTLLSYFGDGTFAEIARSGCGMPTFWDQVVSDNIDLSNYVDASLSFDHYFNGLSFTGVGNVDISVDGGASFTTVYTVLNDVAGETETVAISFADGAANVKIRLYFWYYGGVLFDSFWGVDDIAVTATSLGDDDSADDDAADDDAVDDDAADDDILDDDSTDDDDGDDDDASPNDDDDFADDDITDDDAIDDDADNPDDDDASDNEGDDDGASGGCGC